MRPGFAGPFEGNFALPSVSPGWFGLLLDGGIQRLCVAPVTFGFFFNGEVENAPSMVRL